MLNCRFVRRARITRSDSRATSRSESSTMLTVAYRADAALARVDRGEITSQDLLGAGKKFVLHQRRCLAQIGRADGEPLTVVGASGLDQAGVGRQLRRDLRHRSAEVLVGGAGRASVSAAAAAATACW